MDIAINRDAPVATLTLNRPDRRNALSVEMMQELTATIGRELEATSADDQIGAIILAGEGPAFSAGHDLLEMTCSSDVAHYRRVFDVCTDLMTTIQEVRQPVIAQVDGIATAAGCQLVASCDLAVASQESTFATPGVKIGLFCSTPMVPLTRAIGRKRALEMLLTGRPISAATAADWGLINRVVPQSQLAQVARGLAADIAKASPFTIALGKQAFYSQIDLTQAQAYAYAKEVMSVNAMAADAQEGMAAFLEKREPVWQDK